MIAKDSLRAWYHSPSQMLSGTLLLGLGIYIFGDGGASFTEKMGWYENTTETWFRVGQVVIENADIYDPQELQERYPRGVFETHVRAEPVQLKGVVKYLASAPVLASGGYLIRKAIQKERQKS